MINKAGNLTKQMTKALNLELVRLKLWNKLDITCSRIFTGNMMLEKSGLHHSLPLERICPQILGKKWWKNEWAAYILHFYYFVQLTCHGLHKKPRIKSRSYTFRWYVDVTCKRVSRENFSSLSPTCVYIHHSCFTPFCLPNDLTISISKASRSTPWRN